MIKNKRNVAEERITPTTSYPNDACHHVPSRCVCAENPPQSLFTFLHPSRHFQSEPQFILSYWVCLCVCVRLCVCFERIFSLKDLHWIPNVDTSYEFSFRFAGAKPSRHSVCLANCRQARKSSSKREPSISISEFSPTHTLVHSHKHTHYHAEAC